MVEVSFYHEEAGVWFFNKTVHLVAKHDINPYEDDYITTVEYCKGEFLSIYSRDGVLVGYFDYSD